MPHGNDLESLKSEAARIRALLRELAMKFDDHSDFRYRQYQRQLDSIERRIIKSKKEQSDAKHE
jgi:hypothetical protein